VSTMFSTGVKINAVALAQHCSPEQTKLRWHSIGVQQLWTFLSDSCLCQWIWLDTLHIFEL
jgi:hypothetical protein